MRRFCATTGRAFASSPSRSMIWMSPSTICKRRASPCAGSGPIGCSSGRAPGARALLPMINWIGPTAAFVFRTGARFDPALVQLADVEFYGRVLARGGFVRLAGRSVESLGRHPDQISARIDGRALAVAEIDLLAARRPPPFSPLAYAVYRAALTLRAAL